MYNNYIYIALYREVRLAPDKWLHVPASLTFIQRVKKRSMKATDLRIGNLVLDEDKEVVRVEAIAGDLIHEFTRVSKKLDSGRYQIYGSNVYPIELTEEWLIKLGFKVYERTAWIDLCALKAELHVEIHPAGMVFKIMSGFAGELILNEIKYVHQLQNLHFALTGEELKIVEI